MNELFQSATRFALIVFVIVLSSAFLFIVGLNPHQPDLVTGIVGLFSNVIIAVISFYFGQKGLPTGATVDTHSTDVVEANIHSKTIPNK